MTDPAPSAALRVLVVDDHALVRAGVRSELSSHAADLEVVGDRVPDRATEVIVAAAREALSNAVRHGAPPVSVYAELSDRQMEVFVRDRGPGFDLDTIASDRHGVRESIIARMDRHGGTGAVRRLAQGTEVILSLPTPSQGA